MLFKEVIADGGGWNREAGISRVGAATSAHIAIFNPPLLCIDIDEQLIRQHADLLVSTGLRGLGYNYLNLDDAWSAPNRTAEGRLVGDPLRFPSGIGALADYVHGR